jgi:HEPN domain-containing protein
MHEHEFAEKLIQKAVQDEFILKKLVDDPESPEEGIGFHAQQAVEKLIKAVLALNKVVFPRTHDLENLVKLIDQNNINRPKVLDQVGDLTPYAVEFRYDALPLDEENYLDSSWVMKLVEETKQWTNKELNKK